MTGAPWRPQDIPDELLGRSSRAQPDQAAFGDDFTVSVMEDSDDVFVIMQGVVPVMWPMVMHRHGQECARG